MFQSQKFQSALNRVLQWIIGIYQAAALLAFAASIFLASRWIQAPFMGAFFEQTMVYNGLKSPNAQEQWPLVDQGIQLGDRLVSVFGREVRSADELTDVLEKFNPGESAPVQTKAGTCVNTR